MPTSPSARGFDMKMENAAAAPEKDALKPYLDAKSWQLIPLHHYGDTDVKNGKRRQLGKAPKHKNWTKRPYASFNAKKHMDAGDNVGVRLKADQLVVDVDPRPNGQTLASPLNPYVELVLWTGMDPDLYPTVETGSGGLHIYMMKDASVVTRDSLGKGNYPGIEFKAFGRQVVAAGSIHPDTQKAYQWDALGVDLSKAPLAPADLIALIARPARPAHYAASDAGKHSAEELEAMLEHLDPDEFRDQQEWFELMAACHYATAGDGRQEFIEWSTGAAGYADHAGLIGPRWDSLDMEPSTGTPITHQTLYKALTKRGLGKHIPDRPVSDDFEPLDSLPDAEATDGTVKVAGGKAVGDKKPRIFDGPFDVDARTGKASNSYANALRAVKASKLSMAWDQLKQEQIFLNERLPWDDSLGRTLTEMTVLQVRTYVMDRCQSSGFEPSKEHVHDSLNFHATTNIINPIMDYLNGLEWDGESRVSQLFARGFNCITNDYTDAVSTCFMVGAVARQRDPGCKFDTMPIVNGEQGSLKSTGFKVLFSPVWFSDAAIPKLSDKDAPQLLHGIWMHEFAELASLRKADMNELKAFMSRSMDRYRPPYGRKIENHPRRIVFAGTVNQRGYLDDPTGARRFWPLQMPRGARVDIEWIGENRDQLWADADALYKAGESVVLPERLWAFAAETQKAETTEDPWADEIRDMLADRQSARDAFEAGGEDFAETVINGSVHDPILDEPPHADRIHSKELLVGLGLKPDRQDIRHPKRLREVMEALGWTYKATLRVMGKVAAGYQRDE